jgi:hypothetical protein
VASAAAATPAMRIVVRMTWIILEGGKGGRHRPVLAAGYPWGGCADAPRRHEDSGQGLASALARPV